MAIVNTVGCGIPNAPKRNAADGIPYESTTAHLTSKGSLDRLE